VNPKQLILALALASSTAALAQHGKATDAVGDAHADAAHHGGHVAHHEPHIANWWGIGEAYAETPALGWLTLTFLIFAGGIVYFVRKPLSQHLVTRADIVERAIAEATRAKEDAERRAREAEARLAALDDEVRRMKSDFEVQGRAEAERIEKAAVEMSAKIARDAEETIGAESERARESLRAEASRLALQLAEERIKGLLSAADDDRLKRSLISDLSA
jgi:F-type H+-transporting ATPase subunit b